MTFENYLWCFVAGVLGILFHIFAVKIPGIKKQTQVANMKFDYAQYFKDDLAAILGSLLTVLILLVVLDELVKFKPAVVPYLKAAFVFVGFTGSSLLISLLGKAQEKVNTVVDSKTNELDELKK